MFNQLDAASQPRKQARRNYLDFGVPYIGPMFVLLLEIAAVLRVWALLGTSSICWRREQVHMILCCRVGLGLSLVFPGTNTTYYYYLPYNITNVMMSYLSFV